MKKITTLPLLSLTMMLSGCLGAFWGAGAKAERKLFGPVSINVGYRHRQGFKDLAKLNEDRVNAGLTVDVCKNTTLGANFYLTQGTTNSNTVGLAIARSF